MPAVPNVRVRLCNDAPVRASGRYVLYWMIASRRLSHNFALDRALELSCSLHKPVLIFEALRCDYSWASERLHQFVFDGMADNARVCAKHGVLYFPYVEPAKSAGRGLLQALAADASIVVTDEFPCFFLPQMVGAAAQKLSVRLEAVDSNGLLPLRATDRAFTRAFDFRCFLQKVLTSHLSDTPSANPLSKARLSAAPRLPKSITSRWPSACAALLSGAPASLNKLPIDHRVKPAVLRGGQTHASEQLRKFLDKKLVPYVEHRNKPEIDVASGLSPYLHFGHISVHEVFAELARRENWNPSKLAVRSKGSRKGWWNMSAAAESFLDELITWRELGYNFSSHRADFDQFESLPAWALKTLADHAKDEREHLYSLRQFESAKTHDSLWNAAQTQLIHEGKIHNYLRMLWGKKILEWSRSPQEAAKIMIQLNNKYALDGRDPNSYSGIFWVLGRYDRAWGPERPVFGLIRYMSSGNTARKFSVKDYIRKFSLVAQPDAGV